MVLMISAAQPSKIHTQWLRCLHLTTGDVSLAARFAGSADESNHLGDVVTAMVQWWAMISVLERKAVENHRVMVLNGDRNDGILFDFDFGLENMRIQDEDMLLDNVNIM